MVIGGDYGNQSTILFFFRSLYIMFTNPQLIYREDENPGKVWISNRTEPLREI